MSWREKQWKDHYYQKAKTDGYRSRAAYKLIEIQQKFKIIKPNSAVIDLGCAPGGWLQVLKKQTTNFILGIDLQRIEPISAVNFGQIDFTCGIDDVLTSYGHTKFDLILSDMSPKITGNRDTDHYQSIELVEQVYDFTIKRLNSNGFMVCKVLEGPETQNLVKKMEKTLKIKVYKPDSSRSESREFYLIGASKF